MPTRYLKPGIRDSELIDRVSPLAETLFYRLLVTVDDFGRADARPAMIKAACFPVKKAVDEDACAALLTELAAAPLIAIYAVDGKPYLQMLKWDNTPRAKASNFPAPADGCAHVYATARKPRAVLPETGTGTETGTQTGNREPETGTGTEVAPAPRAGRTRRDEQPSATAETWAEYSHAYVARYKAQPVRNAKINGQLAQLVARLGADEAPQVAAFYVSHNGAFYVRCMHAVDALLRDAEKLRTEWATRRQVTHTAANQADRTQTNLEAFGPLLEAARQREGAA